MRWANFFHIYQPPRWPRTVVSKVAREAYRPLVQFLLKHPAISVTLNISGSLTEQLAARPQYADILKGFRVLLGRKQIECVDSAMYHAILPLLPDHEIKRQITLNHGVNRKILGAGYRPQGFFPPEMAYSPRLGALLNNLGYRWVILDGISHPGIVDYETRYTISTTSVTAVFRNRFVSDYLAFEVQRSGTALFLDTVQRWNSQRELLITAMDGENLGHHRHIAKKIWQSLVTQPHIETVTISDMLAKLKARTTVTPRSASWSSSQASLKHGVPFELWKNPRNSLHTLQWELFTIVHTLIHTQERTHTMPASLRTEFDQSVASDWYWWASREPWWDVDIIVTAAQRLGVIGDECRPSPRIAERMRYLIQRIDSVAREWQRTGAAQRHAARFSAHAETPRYLGGKSVH